ncbi:MAG: hypothetical protein ABIO78_04730 [Thermoanaerobaculia bacterium]
MRKAKGILLWTGLFLACQATTFAADESEKRSLEWMRSQVVPNQLVSTPDPSRRGLILSYAPGLGRPGPLHRKSFVYDGALAAIAFTMADDGETASRILSALTRIQRPNGSFWFSYNVDNAWPAEADHDMAIVRSGANAWVGYALTFYLENRPATDDRRSKRERDGFLASARRIGDFLLTLRVSDKSVARGLLRGGHGAVRLGVTPDGKSVQEFYDDRPIRWVSSEHNISSYFFLNALGRLTADLRYSAAARDIRQGLLSSLWQNDMGQFAQGIGEDGSVDRTRALDCASWGALFLFAAVETEKAAQALRTTDSIYRSSYGKIEGHRPYHEKPIYDDARVQRLLLPDAPATRWKDLSFVWSEGTMGVALAHLRSGDAARAAKLTGEVAEMREGGGIRYGTREFPYEFSAFPSVAGTAWHVIVQKELRKQTKRFWAR